MVRILARTMAARFGRVLPRTWISMMAFTLGCIVISSLLVSLHSVGSLEVESGRVSSPSKLPVRALHRAVQDVLLGEKSASAYEEPRTSANDGWNEDLAENILTEPKAEGNELRGEAAIQRSPAALPAARLLRELSRGADPIRSVPFMIVSGERSSPCVTPEGSNIMMKTYKNKVDYCNLHGCKVWYALEVWEKGFVGTWVRYPLLLRLMKANPAVPWFMWMDSDAIFTDFNFSIPFHTYNSWYKNLVVPGFWEKVYAESPDWMGLNAGIFLIRNCEWSYRFLEKWSSLGAPENLNTAKKALNSALKSRPQEWDPDDQSALVYLLSQNRVESERNVFLEASYSLHGYWDYIVDKFENILQGKDKWPFVTHFCGCNFCGGVSISARCSRGFLRAYNFADDQLVAIMRDASNKNICSPTEEEGFKYWGCPDKYRADHDQFLWPAVHFGNVKFTFYVPRSATPSLGFGETNVWSGDRIVQGIPTSSEPCSVSASIMNYCANIRFM